jgi:hypothetical protein
MLKTSIIKGHNFVEDAAKAVDKLRLLCGTMAAVQIDKELKNLQLFGERVQHELQDKERKMDTTILLLAEINSIYQVYSYIYLFAILKLFLLSHRNITYR